jgi:hypothetical protein
MPLFVSAFEHFKGCGHLETAISLICSVLGIISQNSLVVSYRARRHNPPGDWAAKQVIGDWKPAQYIHVLQVGRVLNCRLTELR